MIKQLAHINIGAADLAASEHFYCEVLGLEKTFDFVKDGEPFGFYAGAGGMTFIEVFRQEPAGGQSMMKHFCLEVEDIDAVIASIREKGWEIGDKSFGADNSWQAWLTDPSGVAIELMEYTEESTQYTGEDCIVNW